MSHTLLHLYFGNKEEIVRQVLKTYDTSAAVELIQGENIDFAVGEAFRQVVADPTVVKVLGAALVEGIVPEHIEAENVAHKALIKRLEGTVEDGVDPRIVSVLVSSMAIGWAIGADWLLDEAGVPGDERDKAVEQAAGILERMIRDCT